MCKGAVTSRNGDVAASSMFTSELASKLDRGGGDGSVGLPGPEGCESMTISVLRSPSWDRRTWNSWEESESEEEEKMVKATDAPTFGRKRGKISKSTCRWGH